MRAIMIMFDTLSREYLSNYGNEWMKTPNFQRLRNKQQLLINSMEVACLACQLVVSCIQDAIILCIVCGAIGTF